MLGVIGVAIGLPMLLLKDRREPHGEAERGAPFVAAGAQRARCAARHAGRAADDHRLRARAHRFSPAWPSPSCGWSASAASTRRHRRQIGALQIVFGILGAVVGGVLSDRLARHIKGGHAGFMVLLVALCGPLMIAYRFAPTGSALFYVGMCAGFFLPLAAYGPALALIQGLTPQPACARRSLASRCC